MDRVSDVATPGRMIFTHGMPRTHRSQPHADNLRVAGREYRWEQTEGGSDREWDDFLQSQPEGQYQQSSLWGEYKASEGWRIRRVLLRSASSLAGGLQLLWKRQGPLGLGYISKGPVASMQEPWLGEALVRRIPRLARELGLAAVIVQWPDECHWSGALMESAGFLRTNPLDLIEATYLVDVRPGMETIRKGYDRTIRQGLRRARDQGLIVRAGTEADVPRFHELMVATCGRQGSSPNPAAAAGTCLIWKLFAARGLVEMALAEYQGRTVAGRMNLLFGRRATQWKKGWSGEQPGLHPNEVLTDHALEWASQQGYAHCDFSAMDRINALRLLAGQSRNGAVARTRDMYNLRFGGRPMLQPRAWLYVQNPAARWLYGQTYGLWEQAGEQRILRAAGLKGSAAGPGAQDP